MVLGESRMQSLFLAVVVVLVLVMVPPSWRGLRTELLLLLEKMDLRTAALGGLSLAILAAGAVWQHDRRRTRRLAAGEVRCCVITGAASGIGRATVLRMESLGWHVLAADFNESGLRDLDAASSDRVRVQVCDVTSPEACDKLKQRTQEMVAELGLAGLAGLANVAGMMQFTSSTGMEEAALQRVVAVNCVAPVRLAKLLMPLLLKAEAPPTLCNVASIVADMPLIWTGAYSATKGFVNNFSISVRREALGNGVQLRVSIVKPGLVLTPMTSSIVEQRAEWARQHPEDPFSRRMQAVSAFWSIVIREKRFPGSFGDFLAGIAKPDLYTLAGSTSEEVAEDIANALTSKAPKREYFSATLIFKVAFGLIHLLPAGLEDFILGLI